MSDGAEEPRKLLERSLVWFVLGIIVAVAVGTVGLLAWLEGFVDRRIANPSVKRPPGAGITQEQVERLIEDKVGAVAPGISEDRALELVREEIGVLDVGVSEARVRTLIEEGLPSRIVVASTVACAELGPRWQPFREATGRFVVGAGDETLRAYRTWDQRRPDGGVEQAPLTAYEVLGTGGEEEHTLNGNEMPEHQHQTQVNGGEPVWGTGSRRTALAGSGWVSFETSLSSPEGLSAPHNNMPPYIALYFCKKNG